MHSEHVAELVSAPLCPNDLGLIEFKPGRILGSNHMAPPSLLDHALYQKVVVSITNLVSVVVMLWVYLHLLLT